MEKTESLELVADALATDLWDGYDGQRELVAAKLEELGWTFDPAHLSRAEYADRQMIAYQEALQAERHLFTCPMCDWVEKWANGRSLRAGDEVNEFWCSRCGAETPLGDEEAARLSE